MVKIMDTYEDEKNTVEKSEKDTPPKKSKNALDFKIKDLINDFFVKSSSKNLGLLNDMIMIYDNDIGYFRLLNPSEKISSNLRLIKKITPKSVKNKLKDLLDILPEASAKYRIMHNFYKTIYLKIITNRHLYCRTNLSPTGKYLGRILLQDGELVEKSNSIRFKAISSCAKSRFLSYLDVHSDEFDFIEDDDSLFISLLKQCAVDNPKILGQTKNLILNLISNHPKKPLLFAIISENKKICTLFLHSIKAVLSSKFYTNFSLKELTKPNNQLLLTDKAANFCEKYFVKSDTKQKNITEQLEILATPSPKTITKGNRTFNFLNRTTLIFSGTAEELKFITEEPALSSKASIIRLPDKLGDEWFEPDLYDHLESYRSEVIQFLYYYNGHEDDSVSISNLSINSEENNDAPINPLNSFERFFNRYVIITGEDKDYIPKQLLFDKYKNYCCSIQFPPLNENLFFKEVANHKSYAKSVREAENLRNKNPKKLPYFVTRKAGKSHKDVEPGQAIYTGIKLNTNLS